MFVCAVVLGCWLTGCMIYRFMAASKVLGEETAAGAAVNEKVKNGQM